MHRSMYSQEQGYDLFGEDDSFSSDADQQSSDDEIDIILHGTPEQKRKLKKLHDRIQSRKGGVRSFDQGSSSEDDFEKEMNAELNCHVKLLESKRAGQTGLMAIDQPETSSASAKQQSSSSRMFYNDIYFDSDNEDDEDENQQKKHKKSGKHEIISNDDLLYDPSLDDDDQKWVDRQRRDHRKEPYNSVGQNQKQRKQPNSDALLDCPACLTTLCLDCQRHDIYKNQYRAMFAMNCLIDFSEFLEFPTQQQKKKKKRFKGEEETISEKSKDDLFNSVKCIECNTVVGVFDTEEVYHFFNVIASHT